jgi:TIR domain
MAETGGARIFISYSRKDGAEFAANLRKRLQKENLSIWQDLIALEGGRDWWSQIEGALKSKALQHFVLVVTQGWSGKPRRPPRDQTCAPGGQYGLASEGTGAGEPGQVAAMARPCLRS